MVTPHSPLALHDARRMVFANDTARAAAAEPDHLDTATAQGGEIIGGVEAEFQARGARIEHEERTRGPRTCRAPALVVNEQLGERTGRHPAQFSGGATRQHDGHLGADHDARRIRSSQVDELFGAWTSIALFRVGLKACRNVRPAAPLWGTPPHPRWPLESPHVVLPTFLSRRGPRGP